MRGSRPPGTRPGPRRLRGRERLRPGLRPGEETVQKPEDRHQQRLQSTSRRAASSSGSPGSRCRPGPSRSPAARAGRDRSRAAEREGNPRPAPLEQAGGAARKPARASTRSAKTAGGATEAASRNSSKSAASAASGRSSRSAASHRFSESWVRGASVFSCDQPTRLRSPGFASSRPPSGLPSNGGHLARRVLSRPAWRFVLTSPNGQPGHLADLMVRRTPSRTCDRLPVLGPERRDRHIERRARSFLSALADGFPHSRRGGASEAGPLVVILRLQRDRLRRPPAEWSMVVLCAILNSQLDSCPVLGM